MGLKFSGNVAPDTVKPAPVIAAALTVTAAVPVEDKVTVCVVGVFTISLPKARLLVLIPMVGTVEPSCRAKVFATLPALAVNVTVVAVLTAEAVAVKFALVAPAATVTVAGTDTAALLLPKLTAIPPLGAAAFSVTVQLSVLAPVSDPFAQLNPLSTGTPVPVRFTFIEVPVEELLVIASCPVAGPDVTG